MILEEGKKKIRFNNTYERRYLCFVRDHEVSAVCSTYYILLEHCSMFVPFISHPCLYHSIRASELERTLLFGNSLCMFRYLIYLGIDFLSTRSSTFFL